MNKWILRSQKKQIAILTIHRPEVYNALNQDVVAELEAALFEIAADDTVRALILTGEGNFAAGADIAAMADLSPEQAKSFVFTETFQILRCLPIPTIAAIEGYALGGGFELALSCDFRVAALSAKMGLPEITLGIMPGAGGTQVLPRLIGEGRAKEMILTGKTINAHTASHWGLVNQVTEKDNVMACAIALAQRLSEQSTAALITAKKTVIAGADLSLGDALIYEKKEWCRMFGTKDQKKLMKTFLRKKKES